MDILYYLHVLAVILALAGAWCIAMCRPVLGQAIWIPSNLLWVVVSIFHGDLWSGLQFGVFLFFAITGVARYLLEKRSNATV